MGATGAAIRQFDTGRMRPLGAAPPSVVERFIAEWQLGDPSSSDDAWRPWRRRNPSQRTVPGRLSDLRARDGESPAD